MVVQTHAEAAPDKQLTAQIISSWDGAGGQAVYNSNDSLAILSS